MSSMDRSTQVAARNPTQDAHRGWHGPLANGAMVRMMSA